MNDGTIDISQRAAVGSETTQIGIQNNYSGMTAQEASQLAMDLFISNFPKLQQVAAEVAQKRVDELTEQIVQQLSYNKVTDFSPFADPDVQYTLFKAQTNYARFGTKAMLKTLTSLISRRIECDNDFQLKVVIDKAISIANYISPQQLDYLSLSFICKDVIFQELHTIEDLQQHLLYICDTFSMANISSVPYLTNMGCLEFKIIAVEFDYESHAREYHFEPDQVKKIYPEFLKQIHTDYRVSYVGTILAITNAEAKSKYKFDPKVWIKS